MHSTGTETKCFPHQCETAGNLIDFINISKERMCQSERGFGGEEPKMKRRALAVGSPWCPEGESPDVAGRASGYILKPTLHTQAEVAGWLPLQYSCREESY